jgi:hypothetical protein
MKSRASSKFWANYGRLPAEIRRSAVKQYRLWLQNPRHPSLQFKKVNAFWSARITDDYRALGVMDGDDVIWFWIGTHEEYERLIKRR